MLNNTIESVVEYDLCKGCGTCISICNLMAIELSVDSRKGIYVPKVDEAICKNCGNCYKACPGYEIDFNKLNLNIFNKSSPNDVIGNYISCYIGHSTDIDIRFQSASGGLVTQMLIFALDKGIIDGALVTRIKKDNPFEPEPFIARTREEIIEASKSKYFPVPANIALSEILKSNENERFAVVGLPCHIQGLRKAQEYNKRLKDQIVLCFGLFCSHTVNFNGMDYLLNKFGIKKEDIKQIIWRADGWPGRLKLSLKNENAIFDENNLYGLILFKPRFFTPRFCMFCTDAMSELADISFGDPWLPEFSDEHIGKSIMISRSKIGEDFIKSANSHKVIELDEVHIDKAIRSQWKGSISYKKKTSKAFYDICKLMHIKTPEHSQILLHPNILDYLMVLMFFFCMWSSSRRQTWFFVDTFTSIELSLLKLMKILKK